MPKTQRVMMGINAAVVRVLLAAIYNPVWTRAIRMPAGFGFALTACSARVLESAAVARRSRRGNRCSGNLDDRPRRDSSP
jgi:hypothetical protein